MPKKKKIGYSKFSSTRNSPLPRHFIIIFFTLAAVLIGTKIIILESRPTVLGESVFLARGGESDENEGDSGSSDSGSHSDIPESNKSGKTVSASEFRNSGTNTSGSSNISSDAPVVCTGPDGKQFSTKYETCKELNIKWNKPINFKALPTQSKIKPTYPPRPTKKVEIENEVEIHKEDSEESEASSSTKSEDIVRLDTLSKKIKTKFVVQSGRLKVKVENEDGTEVELDNKSAAQIERHLEKDDIRFASGAAGRIVIKSGTSSAEAKFPLSYDPTTNQVLLTTPNGDKVVKVMPEQALKGLLNSNAIKSFTASESAMVLEDKNGKPVYVIKGKQNKKIFSIVPIEIEKEVEVSAETGEVVSQNLTIGSRLLNLISN